MAFRLFAAPFLVIGMCRSGLLLPRIFQKISFGSLFFFITVLPVLQIVTTAGAIAAERYTYIPLLGIYFIFAELCGFLFKEKPGDRKVVKTLWCSAPLYQ